MLLNEFWKGVKYIIYNIYVADVLIKSNIQLRKPLERLGFMDLTNS